MHIKHILSVIVLSLCAAWGMAQNHNDIHLPIYTRVGPDLENQQETPVYEHPYPGATQIGYLLDCYHGLCPATLVKNLGDWYLIEGEGYVRATEAVLQSWFDGDGDSIIIAAKPKTYIYVESYDDEEDGDGIVISGEYVAMGTIITDRIEEAGEDYYVLMTSHDYLYVHKNDVEIISRKELALQALQYQMQKE